MHIVIIITSCIILVVFAVMYWLNLELKREMRGLKKDIEKYIKEDQSNRRSNTTTTFDL